MDRLIIEGGARLEGRISCSGSKNAALPIISASMMAQTPMRVSNLPHLRDVTTMLELLGNLGVDLIHGEGMSIILDATPMDQYSVHYDLVRTMRASILVLGPMLARFGRARVAMPGGCAIGTRPIDQHLKALGQMGVDIRMNRNNIEAEASGRLTGKDLTMELITVTGTENVMMAAVLAKGQTIIRNAACEPEIVDLAKCLNQMGAHIEGHGTSTIAIHGVEELQGTDYAIMPDRIEAGTYLVATAATQGKIRIEDAIPAHIGEVLSKLEEAGAHITTGEDWIELDMKCRNLRAVSVNTAPFPGYPTDMQAQITTLNTIAEGSSVVTETVFENRFKHVYELQRMGADVQICGNAASITGIPRLSGAQVVATDLRASASLVLAGLVARGQTQVDDVYHIDRGYDRIEEKLRLLGSNIQRTEAR